MDVFNKLNGAKRWIRQKVENLRYRLWGRSLKKFQKLEDLAVVIVMPDSLQIGVLSLDYLRAHKNVLCIANALSAWELEALRSCHDGEILTTPFVFPHSYFIDKLVKYLNKPFWLVDHDCYLFDLQILQQEKTKLGNYAGIAFYQSLNRSNGIIAPETFLMLLNPVVLRGLQEKYGVTSRAYAWEHLATKVVDRLGAIGITPQRMPQAHKSYFDTFRVLAFLAEADGCGFLMDKGYDAFCRPYPEVIHIGGTSQPQWPPESRYYALGSYFWRRTLEVTRLEKLRQEYGKRWQHVPDSQEMRQQLEASGHLVPGDIPAIFDYLDALATQKIPQKLARL